MQNIKLTLALICTAHILGMIPFAAYPALIPILQLEWSATSTEIGWVAGIYFGGYLLAVIFLVPLTDRVDSRRIYLVSMTITIFALLAFAFFTKGVASASLWRFLQGVGLAGTYMPGLKALVDAVPAQLQSRTVALYTACFGFGVAVSFLVTGILTHHLSWQWVFVTSSVGPLIALVLAMFWLPHAEPSQSAEPIKLIPDFRSVFQNQKALGFSIAYSVHNAELFAFRTWVVALLAFAMTLQNPGSLGINWNPAFIVACATLIAQPFSVVTNELAEKFDRVRVIVSVMLLSAAVGIVLGFSSQLPMLVIATLLCLYAIFSIADSASITSAVVQYANPEVRGTTMAFHTLIGFVGAFAGPIVFGVCLDLAGGQHEPRAWGMAFIALAVLVLIGPIAIQRLNSADG